MIGACAMIPSVNGGRFITSSAFASDSLTVRDRITINAGVRFDHSRAVSQDVHARDVAGRETDEMIAGVGTLWFALTPALFLAVYVPILTYVFNARLPGATLNFTS